MKPYFLIFFVLALLISCQQDSEEKAPTAAPDTVTLIFEKKPDAGKLTKRKFLIVENETSVSYSTPMGDGHGIFPEHNAKNDTIVIKDIDKHCIFSHGYYKVGRSFKYKFELGDTVLVTYEGDIPTSQILNRPTPKGLNFDRDMLARLHDNELVLGLNWELAILPEAQKEQKIRSYFSKLIQEYQILDSLRQANQITIDLYNMQKDDLKLSLSSLYPSYKEKVGLSIPNGIIEEYGYDIDSLLHQVKYKAHLLGKAQSFAEGHRITGKGYDLPDYRVIYDSVRYNQAFSEKTRRHILSYLIDMIRNNMSTQDFERYYGYFREAYPDDPFTEKIRKKYLLDYQNLANRSDSIFLMRLDKQVDDMSVLLEKNRGNVLYVDFWASWCKPCREVMPDSKKLKSDYEEQPFKVVYLSLDRDFNQWKKAAEKEALEYHPESFLVLNAGNADFIKKELNIKAIPRYLLFDKEGKLVHNNAPGPDTDELRSLIDQYLAE